MLVTYCLTCDVNCCTCVFKFLCSFCYQVCKINHCVFQCKLTISSRCRGWRSENSSLVEWLLVFAELPGPAHHILANQSLPFSKHPPKWPREPLSCCSTATHHQWLRNINGKDVVNCGFFFFFLKKRNTRVLTRNHFSRFSDTRTLAVGPNNSKKAQKSEKTA